METKSFRNAHLKGPCFSVAADDEDGEDEDDADAPAEDDDAAPAIPVAGGILNSFFPHSDFAEGF